MRTQSMIVVAVLMVACSETPDQSAGEAADTTAVAGAPTAAEVPRAIAIVVGDTGIESSQDSIPIPTGGQISFSVQNNGTQTKQFTIQGTSGQGSWTSTPIPPGQSVLMSQVLQRGTFQLIWPGSPNLTQEIVVY